MSKTKPLIDADGEVPELGDAFFTKAARGRPSMLPDDRKVRRNFMLDREIAAKLDAVGNKSAFVNELLRKALARAG
ncbi:hypothetical protein [Paracoccus litorisediminis]|uniref:Uncharacterized protein n=1 Tax=Paracoccus litorisediminis TaxID=2006130 RepID=A0A844HTG4_9RHOB|nr:hypothetical protein [Paracoccus litorisediminis]MTH61734.1 hypothetical protein [Paracoccus litorisediminis]